MGYETDFTIRLVTVNGRESDKPDRLLLKSELESATGYSFGYSFADGVVELYTSGKWYECETDVAAVSARLPGFAIEVEGDGEDTEDHWRQRFLDGRAGARAKGRVVYYGLASDDWPKP